ncbi:hypothetical protein IFR05_006379 [Cadophora sp. M221]|nr:hypothetical protein IFR05_006379 [Cadophora sp. M221]
MAKRFFEAVNVGNFHVQKGIPRALEYKDRNRPRIAYWRNNLTVLSHDFDLYFAAYGDKIHVLRPLDLHQTLPTTPDLVLDLPRSPLGTNIRGYINQIHPHDVNNMKVGKLGEFEILLIACDDGDLLAYYTRLLERNVNAADSSCSDASTTHIQPFFHENVGISAWGLAIHQVSRLIAVGTNNSDVHVFQPALAVRYDAETGGRYNQEGTSSDWPERCFTATTSSFTPVSKLDFGSAALGDFERKDCRLVLELGPSGSNIPSIDFVSDENGEASVVLATDVNGKLWSLSLSRNETLEWPEIHQNPSHLPLFDDEFEPRGWGVLCIPISCFMLVKSPQEALGVKQLQFALQLDTESPMHCLQSLDVTPDTVKYNTSSLHPSCSFFVKPLQDPPNELTLESGPTLPQVESDPPFSDLRALVLDILSNAEDTKYMVQQPTHIPGFQSEDWVKCMIALLQSEDWYSHAVGRWLEETYSDVGCRWDGGALFYDDIKALQFLLQLPITVRYRINTWDKLQRAMMEIEDSEKANSKRPELTQTQWASVVKKMQAIPQLQEGQIAIIRTSAQDIELIPPNTDMLSTICRNFLQQKLPRQVIQESLDRFDRLNMFAVIPELFLLVVASQKGRVGLFTLTRLENDFSQAGPAVMFRHEHVLPFTAHEKGFRPFLPLLGVAVGPLQGKDKHGGVQRKIWRLILHYTDHTILSYELKRKGIMGSLEIL